MGAVGIGIMRSRASSGGTRRIASGDRFFLVRLGEVPKGIIGSGWVLSDPVERLHRSARKPAVGVIEVVVDIEFDLLLDPATEPILTLDQLSRGALGQVAWAIENPCIRVPDDVAHHLEQTWAAFYGHPAGSRGPMTIPGHR